MLIIVVMNCTRSTIVLCETAKMLTLQKKEEVQVCVDAGFVVVSVVTLVAVVSYVVGGCVAEVR